MINQCRLAIVAFALCVAALTAPAQAEVHVVTDEKECTGPPSDTRLYITVSDIRDAQGWIAVTLYGDDRSKFLARNGSLYIGRIVTRSPVTRVCIHVPEPGYYAVAVYHDENANSRIDRRAIGLPTEGFGFSNNAATFLSMPTFRGARMRVNADGDEIGIRMKYP